MRNPIQLSKLPDRDTFLTDPGSPIRVVYAPVIEDGAISLTPNGKQNIQTLIDSYRETTDMAFIMSRLLAGDDSPLHAANGFYGDASCCTYNHAEMLQNVMDARSTFDNLPEEVRHKFNDSFVDWFTLAGSEEWAKLMTYTPKPVSEPPKSILEPENKVVE